MGPTRQIDPVNALLTADVMLMSAYTILDNVRIK